MANYLTTDTELTSIANAIRTKGGTNAQLTYPSGFVTAINNISTGGGAVEVAADLYAANAGTKMQVTLDNNGSYYESNQDNSSNLYNFFASGTPYCMVANSAGNVLWKGFLMDFNYSSDGADYHVLTGGGIRISTYYQNNIEYQPGEIDPETGEQGPDIEVNIVTYYVEMLTEPIATKAYFSTTSF